jgi:Mg-chelatase subunit ChlD
LETNFDETYCELDANIVVVVDGSASVGDTNFAKMKQFLTDFFTQLKPQATGGKLKVGLTQFADDVTVQAALTSSMDSLVSAVATMTHKKGNTNTRDAYLSGLNQITAAGSGKDTQNFIILMTDGKTDGGWYAAQ